VNARVQALYNVARPSDYFMSTSYAGFAPRWQVQFQIQFLFPKTL
jgi:hypothetical protein